MKCNHQVHKLDSCYDTQFWTDVPFDDFVNCERNLAFNRQTRMLAELNNEEVNCYSNLKNVFRSTQIDSKIGQKLLESAKRNLRELAFFGLLERQVDSQTLFENKFNVEFIEDFEQKSKTVASKTPVTEEQIEMIEKYNSLDIELYKYAVTLFNQRLRRNG